MTNEVYLGDGVYVSHDGYAIVLRAPYEKENRCERITEEKIWLEPPQIAKLMAFVAATRVGAGIEAK